MYLHPCDILLIQELKPTDFNLRKNFVIWLQTHEANFTRKIAFSYKARLTLDKSGKKQHCCTWAKDNA